MPANSDIEALQHFLKEWARWTEAWQPKLGYPARVPFIELMKPTFVFDGEGCDERIDVWAMGIIDSSVESLPRLLHAALYAHYLHDQPHSDLTARAEEQLIPMVVRKNLHLG